jgi:hypothetical protein
MNLGVYGLEPQPVESGAAFFINEHGLVKRTPELI